MKKTPLREGRLYAMLALAFVVLAGADLIFYSSVEEAGPVANDLALTLPPVPPADLTPPGPNACVYDATIPAVADPSALVSASDYTAGNADAPVTVVEFFEPNCPHCRTFYPVMKQVIDANAAKARFVIKPVIFWPKSTLQGQALYAAQEAGKFQPMLEAQFANPRPNGLTEEDLRKLASGIGMDGDAMMQKINDRGFTTQLYRMREAFQASGNNSVPAVLINGRTVDGASRTAACLTQLINEAAANSAG